MLFHALPRDAGLHTQSGDSFTTCGLDGRNVQRFFVIDIDKRYRWVVRLDQFDLNLLIAFDAMMQERSVTRAAKRLNVTQSAMSASLRRLRDALQDELLVQRGKKMFPTPHALALAPEVGATLIKLRGLLSTAAVFDPATSKRRFRIGTSDYIATAVLLPVIAGLEKESPSITLELSLPNDDTFRFLEAGEIDLAIMPEAFVQGPHPRELLFCERLVIIACQSNPIVEQEISKELFLQSSHVAVRIAGRSTFIENALNEVVPDRKIVVTAPSFIQVPWLVRNTKRLAVMHERLARVSAPIMGLKIVEPPFSLPTMREMMTYHESRANDAGLVWLRQRLHAATDDVSGDKLGN